MLQCYELAVKSYSENRKTAYESEVQAYKGLANKPGMLRYFGRYSHPEQGHTMYNILLEFGQKDLLEYFWDTTPPTESVDIIRRGELICEIAKAIRSFHQLVHGARTYHGLAPIPPFSLD